MTAGRDDFGQTIGLPSSDNFPFELLSNAIASYSAFPSHNHTTMQKVIQRTARAQRVATRKHARLKAHKDAGEAWERGQQIQRIAKANSTNIKTARRNRKEDWELGPLAPRRDVGDKVENYGAMSMYDVNPPELQEKDKPKWYPIAEGDRVVVVEGRERGKIATVQEVLKDHGAVRLKGVNMVDVEVPEWMNREDNTEGKIQAVPRSMPVNYVRLVYPLPDPETGISRDVIIDRLELINKYHDKTKDKYGCDRLVPGTNTLIPWPEMSKPQYEDHEDDTLRITVEEQTFRPILMNYPFPRTVIDELRNKYSKFRTRHDYEYIVSKEAEDARVEKRKELAKGMRTPLQQLAELRRKKAEEERQKELSEEQLDRIGAVIAAERAKAVDGIGKMSLGES